MITQTNREPGCPLKRIFEEIDLLTHEKHQAYRLSSIQEAVGLLSDTLQLLRRNERLLRHLKCLTALKNLQQVTELYRL